MRLEVCRDPIYHIIFHDFFTPKQNQDILKEAIKLRKYFTVGTTGKGVDKPMRSNHVCYYDTIYLNRRKDSVLLSLLDNTFTKNEEFRDVLGSSPYPVSEFMLTTTHESQVSRYGDKKQKYKWHIDRFANYKRMISFIYWFFKEPKKFKGGEFYLTNSPTHDGGLVEEIPNIKQIIPQNNMAVAFSSVGVHQVAPTVSPKRFESGRFSVNCWIGFA